MGLSDRALRRESSGFAARRIWGIQPMRCNNLNSESLTPKVFGGSHTLDVAWVDGQDAAVLRPANLRIYREGMA